jgi:RNA polymerase sigma-70 factor (ECF subfamily)
VTAVVPAQRDPQQQLRAAAAAGDRVAFGQLCVAARPHVLRVVLHRCGDRQLAEDVTQDAIARALSRASSYRDLGRPFEAWLVTIACRLVVDHAKSGWRRYMVAAGGPDDLPPAPTSLGRPVVEPDVVVVERLTHLEHARVLAAALRCLSRPQRTVLQLRFWRGLSVEDTAAAMGLSRAACKAVQHRAIRTLARQEALRSLRAVI